MDYIETYTALLDALAIYGSSGSGKQGKEDEKQTQPLEPNAELIALLEKAITATESFLLDEVYFDLQLLITANGLQKIADMEKGINAVYTNDETKSKFQILAREVFKKYKALQPHKILNEFARKYAIDAIYNAIEDNEKLLMWLKLKKIQEVVDKSIDVKNDEPESEVGNIIDLSGLDFEIFEKYFLKAQHKNAAVQTLKNLVESKLKSMVEKNPLTVDYYKKYQEIIDEYNRGKDEVVIRETFRKLIELVNSYSAEEADTRREGLTEEQKAIFDILRYGKQLNWEDREIVKNISVDLLAELKKEKLQIEFWQDKTATNAAVNKYISDILYMKLPFSVYKNDDIDLKTGVLFDHIKARYFGGH
ncbi:MAG: DUF3387 domain-containing protein [Saprospiraceae bacterium]|nr:DUF3387 domain-containing protein [Saprospiraceae bacterium]